MLREVNQAKEFFLQKFGQLDEIPAGDYAVPTETSRGDAYMKITIGEDGRMSDFHLFWDEAMTLSWYDYNPDGTLLFNEQLL